MPRTAEEIRAELATLKGQGVDGRTKAVRDLRAELKVLEDRPTEQDADTEDQAPQAEVHVEVGPGAGSVSEPASGAWADLSQGPYDSEEWAFIEKCLSKIKIEGQRTGRFKFLYHDLEMQVRIWRRIRQLVAEVGVGGTWPKFETLDMDANTGEASAEMQARINKSNGAVEAPEPAPQAPKPGPDPQAVLTSMHGGGQDVNDMAKAIAQSMREEFAQRPKSEKPPVPTV